MDTIESIKTSITDILNKLGNPLSVIAVMLSLFIFFPTHPVQQEIVVLAHRQDIVEKEYSFYVMYDLLKQGDEMLNNPNDIREADFSKFQRICTSDRFINFVKTVPGEPFTSNVSRVCKVILDLNYKTYIQKLEKFNS